MKVYLEYIFFINFFFDFILLFGTTKVLKEPLNIKRIIIGSLIGSTSILLIFIKLNNIELFIYKLLLSSIMILITFNRKKFFKCYIYFYLLSIILGGSLYLFDISYSYNSNGVVFIKNGLELNIVLILLITPIIIYLFIKERLKYKTIYSNNYTVEIFLGKNKYTLSGMIDTGNMLKDPYKNKDIILVDINIDITKYKFIVVPFKALNHNGIIYCINPDRVIINNKIINNCLIGLSNNKFSLNGASCILPNNLKEELL